MYSEKWVLRTTNCDLNGRWKPSAILEAMQEVALAHCETLGLGRRVTDGLGVVWVLSRQHVELARLPRIGETFTIQTCAMPLRHLFYPRAHIFRDADGAAMGTACGLWLLMDARTRTTVQNEFVMSRMAVETPEIAVRLPATVRPLNDAPEAGDVLPRFTEFDLNGHVNNARYMDWCWNALGFDALADREVAAFDVNYEREVRRGEVISTRLCREGDAATFHGSANGQRCFSIGVKLRETDYRYQA